MNIASNQSHFTFDTLNGAIDDQIALDRSNYLRYVLSGCLWSAGADAPGSRIDPTYSSGDEETEELS